MKVVLLSVLGASVLATAASAAPISSTVPGASASNIEQVRVVCNENGRCWQTRGPRYVTPYDDDRYYERRSYNYYGSPGYYGPGYGYGGPSVGFSFGTGRW